MPVTVQLMLVNGDGSAVPLYAKPGDSGCDGKARLAETLTICSGCTALIPIGIKVAIPDGYEIQVRPRSGLALKESVTVLNTPGTIDGGYRNEVGVILINHGKGPFYVKPGDRICQLVLNKVEQIQWEIVEELPPSERGEGGFGHSGV